MYARYLINIATQVTSKEFMLEYNHSYRLDIIVLHTQKYIVQLIYFFGEYYD